MSLEAKGSSPRPSPPTTTPNASSLNISTSAQGHLIPLKTTLETRAQETLLNVYITSVPVKQASGTLDIIRKLLPSDGGLDLQHLRRFAKPSNLPPSVLATYIFGPAHGTPVLEGIELFLIIGSTNLLPEQTIIEALTPTIPTLKIGVISIPLLAPTSQEQAKKWSEKYWPTVYKKSNPFGPHVALVARAEEEIAREVGGWMDLAGRVARDGMKKGVGEGVGVVVVERKDGKEGRVIAVACDARWDCWFGGKETGDGVGNVTAHAALRAIGMVAEGLRNRGNTTQVQNQDSSVHVEEEEQEIFRDKPVLEIEKEYYDTEGNENSYLCHELEIYCSHEPCVMCSMAIVHSRFGRLVFEKRMRGTGGVCADADGLGHGLWWRKELNWTMLAWQFVREGEEVEGEVREDLNA